MNIEVKAVITEPDIELNELKTVLRVKTNGHDVEIASLLRASISYLEAALDTTIGVKRYEVVSESALDNDELPYGPVVELEDESIDDADYIYTYTAGRTITPPDIKRGIMLLCKYWFEIGDMASTQVPVAVKAIVMGNTRNPMF